MVASLQGLKSTFKSEETASNQSVSKILIASCRQFATDICNSRPFSKSHCCKYYAAGFARLSRIMLRLLM